MRKSDHTTTKNVLLDQTLPEQTNTYTVIPNKFVMDLIETELDAQNFIVKKELYAAYNNNDVAIGRYIIHHDHDPDLSMMFYFINSYDKSQRFRCGIGAIINTNDAMFAGDSQTFNKIHKGTALDDAEAAIKAQIHAAGSAYTTLAKHKRAMETINFTDKQFYELIGELYLKNMVTPYQLGIIKSEYDTPSYDYINTDNNMWTLYNHIQVGLKRSHSKNVFNNVQLVHYHICNKYKILTHPIVLGIEATTETEEVTNEVDIDEVYVDPNQTSILDEIENLENNKSEVTINDIPADELDLQDLQDVQDELDQEIEETIGEPISETESIVSEMLDDDMSSCPEATEEEANELLHGVDNTGGLENAANEEADMIKNEEIIEDKEEEDVFNAIADVIKPAEELGEDSGLTSFLDESVVDTSETLLEEEVVEEESLEKKLSNALEEVYGIDPEGFSYEEVGDEYIVTTGEGDTLVFDIEDF